MDTYSDILRRLLTSQRCWFALFKMIFMFYFLLFPGKTLVYLNLHLSRFRFHAAGCSPHLTGHFCCILFHISYIKTGNLSHLCIIFLSLCHHLSRLNRVKSPHLCHLLTCLRQILLQTMHILSLILRFILYHLFQCVNLLLAGFNVMLVIWYPIVCLGFEVLELVIQIYHSTLQSLLWNYPVPFVLVVFIVWNGWTIVSNRCILASFSPLNALLFRFYLMSSRWQALIRVLCWRNLLLLTDLTFAWYTAQSASTFGHDSRGGKFTIGSFIEWHLLCENRRWWMDGLRIPIGQRFQWRCIHSDVLLLCHILCVNLRWCSDAVVSRGYLLGGGSGGSAFTVTLFFG